MTKVSTGTEGSILDVIRELDSGRKPHEVQEKVIESGDKLDPVKLRDSIREKLEIVSIVEKTKFAKLVEGSCGKSITELRSELQSALCDLDIFIEENS